MTNHIVKKHFDAIANVIAQSIEELEPDCNEARYALLVVALRLCDLFEKHNAFFKRDRFLASCGFAYVADPHNNRTWY